MIAAAEQPTSFHGMAFCDFVAKRSNGVEADHRLTQALTACLAAGIEVVSVRPERVELRLPCDLAVISPLQEVITQLEAGLSPEVADAISYAFREMLCNAVEYGGHLDPTALVEVRAEAPQAGVHLSNQRSGRRFRPFESGPRSD